MKPFYRVCLCAVVVIVALGTSNAQTKQYLSHEDSDPQAVQLLEQLYQALNAKPVSLDFEMTISYPAEDPIVQQGSLVQQQEMYRIQTDEAEIWCDGMLRWIMVKGSNEVNLYSAADDDAMGPTALIAEYTGDGFIAAVTGEEQQPGKLKLLLIELKPVDRASHISKVRIAVDAKGNPDRMEVFEKNAARTTLRVKSISHPGPRDKAYFTFDKSKFPNVHVEDLRID